MDDAGVARVGSQRVGTFEHVEHVVDRAHGMQRHHLATHLHAYACHLGQRINLPSGANVFNVAWLPGKNGDQLVMLTEDERLKIFQGANQTLIHTTMERFYGSATAMEHYKGMPGLGVARNYQMPSKYFAPMRLIVADIGHTGEYTLLVNKPISTAAQIFDRWAWA